jgi:hypothetical protein
MEVSQWSLVWIIWIRSPHCHPLSSRRVLILSSHMCLDFPSVLFSSDFSIKILYWLHMRALWPATHILLVQDLKHSRNLMIIKSSLAISRTSWLKWPNPRRFLLNRLTRVVHPQNFGAWIMKLLTTQFSAVSCHVLHHRSKYSPQHIVLKHTQPMFSTHETDQVSHPYKRTSEISVFYILIFMCFEPTRNYRTKSELSGSKRSPEFNLNLLSSEIYVAIVSLSLSNTWHLSRFRWIYYREKNKQILR